MFNKDKVMGFISGALVMGLLSATVFAAPLEKKISAVYDDIKIYVDGVLVLPKDANGNVVEPFVSEGTTYLPVRAVGQALAKEVSWDGETKSVYVGKKPENKIEQEVKATENAINPTYVRPSWISIKLPNDSTLYPVTMQYQPLVDTANSICYSTDATMYRILSLANYGYRILEMNNSTYPKMIDLKNIHYKMNYSEAVRFGKPNYIGNFYDDAFPAKRYEISTKVGEQKGGALLYERECMLPIDKMLDFFEVKYDKIWYSTEKDMVIIELSPSEKLKLIEE